MRARYVVVLAWLTGLGVAGAQVRETQDAEGRTVFTNLSTGPSALAAKAPAADADASPGTKGDSLRRVVYSLP